MITIEQAAHRVADNGGEEREVFLDPLTISIISAVISSIFSAMRLWCVWRQGQKANGEQIKEACVNPTWHVRRRVRSRVRQQVGETRYLRYGDEMVSAILKAGAAASPAELKHLADQAEYTNQWGEMEQEL